MGRRDERNIEMIKIETRETVACLQLDRGVTNPIDSELLDELRERLRGAESDEGVRALVLTGVSEKFLSIGFDIPALYPLDREGMRDFFRLFNEVAMELFLFPKPTIAAIRGHAVAGGCILALLCDRRFIAAGKSLMGLNEVKLGVPVPCLADRITRDLAGNRHARTILEEGEFHPPEETLAFGLVDRVLPGEELLEAAQAEALRLGALPPAAFALIKGERTREIAAYVKQRQADMETDFLDCWFAPGTRAQLEAAMENY
jgi:enoyl-CoA hydratase/carnithine racemase